MKNWSYSRKHLSKLNNVNRKVKNKASYFGSFHFNILIGLTLLYYFHMKTTSKLFLTFSINSWESLLARRQFFLCSIPGVQPIFLLKTTSNNLFHNQKPQLTCECEVYVENFTKKIQNLVPSVQNLCGGCPKEPTKNIFFFSISC